MTTCLGFPRKDISSLRMGEVQCYTDLCERKVRDSRITAFALTIITITLFSFACVLFGVATLSPEFMMGLGMFPYFAGIFLGAVGLGVFIGALTHLAIASVRDFQKREWEQHLRGD